MHVLAAPAAYGLGELSVGGDGYLSYMIMKNLAIRHNVRFTAFAINDDTETPPPHGLSIVRPRFTLFKGSYPAPHRTYSTINRASFFFGCTISGLKALKREKMDIIHHICPVFINKVTFNPLALLGVTRRYPFVIGPVGREFNVADTRRSLLSWSNEASLIRKLDATLHYTEATVLARTGLSDKTLESCDALIAPTAESRNFWARLLDPKKIRMIPLGVDDRLFIPKNRDGRGRAIRLLAVGALTRRKGVDYLIKAFKRVADEDERVSLTISGEGPEKKNLLRLVEDLRISDRVTFRGLLRSRSRLVERYQSCDIFCHPALLETYGMVVLEAMACGKPVVVTKGCGVAEFVRHGEDGLLVPPGDVDALADAIIRLVGDEDLRKEMGGRVRRSVERDLSWRAVADKYYQVYSELANA